MKTSKLIMAVLVVFASVVLQSQAEAVQRYKIKSGYIKYDITGQNNGTEEVYWDNYGDKEARYTNTSVTVFGMTQTQNTTNYLDGDWAYAVDNTTGTATKINQKEMMEKMSGGTEGAGAPTDFSDEMIKAFGGVKVGSEKIMGRNTDIYELKNMGGYKVWVVDGIALKAEANFMGFAFKMTAVEFKENIRVDQAKLTLPSSIQVVREESIEDMPDAAEMKEAMDMMNQMQNNPEFKKVMDQMQQMQNDPSTQDAMRQAFEAQQKAMPAAASTSAANTASDAGSVVVDRAGDIVVQETGAAAEDALRETTREGAKKLFGGFMKALK